LQEQVGLLFEALGVQPNEVFAANFIPFRSPSWSQLPDKEGALAFGRGLWTNILTRSPRPPFRLFISLGKQSGRELATLLKACFVRQHSVEWEPQKIDEYVAPDGRTVLTGRHDGTSRLWDIATGNLIRSFEGHTFAVWSAVFSPDGRFVVVQSEGPEGKPMLWLRALDAMKPDVIPGT